jgi:hypothetical protein
LSDAEQPVREKILRHVLRQELPKYIIDAAPPGRTPTKVAKSRNPRLSKCAVARCCSSGTKVESAPTFLSDFDGTIHRDVKLFVLHDKVAQLQAAHGDREGGCPVRGSQGPNRFEDVDV